MSAPANQPTHRTGILFVCLGNICRSPMAEGAFRHLARERGALDRFDVDSAGTGHWHAGEPADPRAQTVARRRGVTLESVARQVDALRDFARFDLIVPMDRQNERDLLALGSPRQRTRLLRSFDPATAHARGAALDVPDPYFGGATGFDDVFDMIAAACRGLLDELLTR